MLLGCVVILCEDGQAPCGEDLRRTLLENYARKRLMSLSVERITDVDLHNDGGHRSEAG